MGRVVNSMPIEFDALVSFDWDARFAEDLNSRALPLDVKTLAQDLLRTTDCASRRNKWAEMGHLIGNNTGICSALAHPYYLGIGNPTAKVLIIGNELAFDVTRLEKLFNESVNTRFNWEMSRDLWRNLSENTPPEEELVQFKREYGFCPLHPFADSYYALESSLFAGGHAFKKYALLTEHMFAAREGAYAFTASTISRVTWRTSFFSKIYALELSHIPAQQLAGVAHAQNVLELCEFKSFLKTFKVVILPKNVLNKRLDRFVTDLFGETHIATVTLRSHFTLRIYWASDIVILAGNQLSNSGWRNSELKSVGVAINQYLSGGITPEEFAQAIPIPTA